LDYGASAVLSACAGGLAVVLARRRRILGVALFAAVAAWFLYDLAVVARTAANVADIEHLVALLTGAAVEWRVSMSQSRAEAPVVARA
jgi:hypothetical protein